MYSFIALVQQACIHTYTCTLCHNDVMGTNGFVWLQCWYHLQVVMHVIRPGVHRIIYM